MAWIESHQELLDHPKTLRLSNMLKIKPSQTIGHLMCLWWWSLKYAEDGVLARFKNDDLSLAARFDGNPDDFVNALVDSKFLDDSPLRVHDWVRYAGTWLRNKYATSSRQWLVKTWRIYGLKYGDKKATDKQVVSNKKASSKQVVSNKKATLTLTKPIPIPKEKNTTSLEPLKDDVSQAEPVDLDLKKPKELTDVQKVVTVFKMCQGVPRDDKSWDRIYFSRFTKSAKALIDLLGDWRSAGLCVQEIYEKLNSKGFTVTLETIIKHASIWKIENCEKEEKNGVFPSSFDGNRETASDSNRVIAKS